MLDLLNRSPLISHLLPFLLALMFLASAANSVRTGLVRATFGSVIAKRSNDPVMFWIYVAGMIALAGVLVAAGVGLIR